MGRRARSTRPSSKPPSTGSPGWPSTPTPPPLPTVSVTAAAAAFRASRGLRRRPSAAKNRELAHLVVRYFLTVDVQLVEAEPHHVGDGARHAAPGRDRERPPQQRVHHHRRGARQRRRRRRVALIAPIALNTRVGGGTDPRRVGVCTMFERRGPRHWPYIDQAI